MKRFSLFSIIAAATIAASFIPSGASAGCYCVCINNKITKVCENSWDPAGGTYCSGTYCTGSLLDPSDNKLALLDIKPKPLISTVKN